MDNTNSPEETWVHRAGGIAAIIFGIAYVSIMALYLPLGGKPTGAEAWLSQTAEFSSSWWGILGLSVLTDFLLVPISLSLYLALKKFGRNAMLIATAFVGLFVVLDLALTWTNIGSLITLGEKYATAANEAERTVVATAAIYPSSVADSNLIFIYNSFTLAVGILLTGLVMQNGVFNKATAYTGIATGVCAIVSVASSFFSNSISGMTIILASLLTMVWYFLVGFRFFKLGQ
ncbi:MAG: hypothetical protein L6Q49_03780 [Anaerolineales bacterium]|nr:hypothetical protein [Anaerolineales bacterium]